MPRPSRCSSGRWRSANARSVPTIPIPRHRLNNLAAFYQASGPRRRCAAAGAAADRKRPRATPRRAAGAAGRAAAAIDIDRKGPRRCAQRDPARHPVAGGVRREQARRAARRRKRPPCGTGAPGSGSRGRSGMPWTRRSWRRSRRSAPSATSRPKRAPGPGLPSLPANARACKKPLPAEFPNYAALSNPLPMTANGNSGAAVG